MNIWLATVVLQCLGVASAQEAVRHSLANEIAVETNHLDLESLPYTLYRGGVRLLVTPSMEADWNDNVTLSKQNTIQDFILRPMVWFDGSYPLTQQNLLQLHIGVGYDAYLLHSEFSALRLDSGSQISLDTFYKDFKINTHDNLKYIQDPAEEASVAGTGRYGGLDNTAGLCVAWDLDDVQLNLGYDHRNFVSSDESFDYLNLASEIIAARVGYWVYPELLAGGEVGGAFTTYDQPVLNDNTSYNVGLFADWKPGSYFQFQAQCGYTTYLFAQTSKTFEAFNQHTVYGGLTATHDITDALSYDLSAGHEIRLGSSADFIKDWYVRSHIRWRFKNLSVKPNLSFESGQQGEPNIRGNFHEDYNWWETGFDISQLITANLTLTLTYRLTMRPSTVADRTYDQNFVGVGLAYQFF